MSLAWVDVVSLVQAAAHPSLRAVLGMDVDPVALHRSGVALSDASESATVEAGEELQVELVRSNYADVAGATANWRAAGGAADGILMDLVWPMRLMQQRVALHHADYPSGSPQPGRCAR